MENFSKKRPAPPLAIIAFAVVILVGVIWFSMTDRTALGVVRAPEYPPSIDPAAVAQEYDPQDSDFLDYPWENPPLELVGRWLHAGSPVFVIYADGTGTMGGIPVESWQVRGSELMVSLFDAETTVVWSINGNLLTFEHPSSGPLAAMLMGYAPLVWHDLGDITYVATADSAIDSTSINFVFSASVPGLTAGDITVSNGVGLVTPGGLTGSGTRWSLAVDVYRVGDVSVSVNRPGVSGASRTAVFYLTSLRSVSVGEEHVAVVRTDGSLWAWGANRYGNLGDGTTVDIPSPTRIGAGANWAYVSAGDSHTAAIGMDGSLWVWGANDWGQLGDSGISASLVPVRVGENLAPGGWIAVSAGDSHTAAVGADGSLWAWGRNVESQLGDGTTTNRRVPTRIGADANWVSVSAGRTHTAAVRADGSLWVWGANWSGQLGTGVLAGSSSPARVGTEADWVSVSAGRWHTVAVRADGSLWAWGGNGSGQLGDGTTYNRRIPVRVGEDRSWISASAGGSHTAAVGSDGSVFAWGRRSEGQFGDAVFDGSVPTRVAPGYGWAFVSAGRDVTVAVRGDGSHWLGEMPDLPGLAGVP